MAADHGDPHAQESLGSRYLLGVGVEKAPAKALVLLLLSAEQGYSRAQRNLGACYVAGLAGSKDLAEALRWYRKAAEQGDADAQCKMGLFYAAGLGTPKDEVEGLKWMRRSADQGFAEAETAMGASYHDGKFVKQDIPESLRWYRRGAEHGYAVAQVKLGDAYLLGEDGVVKDPVAAVKWYRMAADNGDLSALEKLGICLASGNGAAIDRIEASACLQLAGVSTVEARDHLKDLHSKMPPAQIEAGRVRAEQIQAKISARVADGTLGVNFLSVTLNFNRAVPVEMDEQGKGLARASLKNVEQLREFNETKTLAESGDAVAQSNLAGYYYEGSGVPVDLVLAFEWTRKAANQGYVKSQYALGYCYATGKGVPVNLVEAYAYYALAAPTVNAAAGRLGELAKTMSPEQIVVGRKRLDELQAATAAQPARK
jgi:TPR repeat protein